MESYIGIRFNEIRLIPKKIYALLMNLYACPTFITAYYTFFAILLQFVPPYV